MSSVLCPGLLAHPPPLVEGLAALMCNDNLCLSSWLQTAFKGLHHLAFLWLLNTARIPLEGVGGVLGRREQGRRALSSHHSLKREKATCWAVAVTEQPAASVTLESFALLGSCGYTTDTYLMETPSHHDWRHCGWRHGQGGVRAVHGITESKQGWITDASRVGVAACNCPIPQWKQGQSG